MIGVAPEGAAASVKLYLDLVLARTRTAPTSPTIMFSLGASRYPAAFEQKLAAGDRRAALG